MTQNQNESPMDPAAESTKLQQELLISLKKTTQALAASIATQKQLIKVQIIQAKIEASKIMINEWEGILEALPETDSAIKEVQINHDGQLIPISSYRKIMNNKLAAIKEEIELLHTELTEMT